MKAKGYADHKGSSGNNFHMAGVKSYRMFDSRRWVADHGGSYHRTGSSRRLARAACRKAWRNGEA